MPFLSPDPVDPLPINPKAVVLQQRRDNPVTIHRLLVGIVTDECDCLRLVDAWMRHIARTRALEVDQLTCPPLRQPSLCH